MTDSLEVWIIIAAADSCNCVTPDSEQLDDDKMELIL
jgi:hypothetical protein